MTRQAIINGFTAGEVSPLLDMRSDLKGTKFGVKQAVNFVPLEQGPIATRKGTEILENTNLVSMDSPSFDEAKRFGRLVYLYDAEHESTNYYVWCRNSYSIEDEDASIVMFSEYSPIFVNISGMASFFNTESTSMLQSITILQPPGLSELWFFHPYLAARVLRRILVGFHYEWVMEDLVFTNTPSEWGTSSGTNNSACFFKNRLYVAGGGKYGHIFWASKVGEFTDFTIGSNPSDAMKYELTDPGAIRWLMGAGNLLIGTQNYEYVVSAENGVIMPGDIDVKIQSRYGSALNSAIALGNSILYRSADNKEIRRMEYRWKEDRWVSQNLLFSATHMTKKTPIIQMTYDSYTQSIYCLLADKTLIQGLLEIEVGTVGWVRWDLQGSINAIMAVGYSLPALYNMGESENSLFIINYDTLESAYFLVHNNTQESLDRYLPIYNSYSEFNRSFSYPNAFEGLNIVANSYAERVGTDLWDAEAAIFYDGTPYSWTGTNIVVNAGLRIVADNYAFENGPLSSLGDLTNNLEVGKTYALEFTYENNYYMAVDCTAELRNYDSIGGSYTLVKAYQFINTHSGEHVAYPISIVFEMPTPAAAGLYLHLGTISTTGKITLKNPAIHEVTIKQEYKVIEDLEFNALDSAHVKSDVIVGDGSIGQPYSCILETNALNRETPNITHGKRKRWAKAFIRIVDSYPLSIESRTPKTYAKETRDIQITPLGWDREATITCIQDKPYKTVIAGVYGSLGENSI